MAGTQQSISQLLSGLELPSVIESRQASADLAREQAKELRNKVVINTPQGKLLVSPEKAADFAIHDRKSDLDERKVIMDEAMSKPNLEYTQAQIDYMRNQSKFLDSQVAMNKAENDEYMKIVSPIDGDVDENGFLNTYNIKARDYLQLEVGKLKGYITDSQEQQSLINKRSEELAKIVDKLRLVETGFLGKDNRGNKNANNPSRIPDSQYFNQFASTPYIWLWDDNDKMLKQIQLPQYSDGHQLTAREVFQANQFEDVLTYLLENFPEFMKQQGVTDASRYRKSLQ